MKKVLIKVKDYNGYKNVLFVVKTDDFRINYDEAYRMFAHKGDEFATKTAKKTLTENVVLGNVDVKKKVFIFEGKTYDVFSDASVRARA